MEISLSNFLEIHPRNVGCWAKTLVPHGLYKGNWLTVEIWPKMLHYPHCSQGFQLCHSIVPSCCCGVRLAQAIHHTNPSSYFCTNAVPSLAPEASVPCINLRLKSWKASTAAGIQMLSGTLDPTHRLHYCNWGHAGDWWLLYKNLGIKQH